MRGLVVASLCICAAIVHAETPESSAVAPTIPNKNSPPGKAPEGMVWISGGEFSMGASTSGHGTEEMPMASNDSEPVHRVYVDGFWMDATPVTNEQFEKFVKATDYDVPLNNHYQWWSYVKGASWRHPLGPQSDIKGKEKFPVVQIAYPDAEAYAKWAGKRLPTEAEFEFAARGGLSGKVYVWGDEFRPGGKWMANTWQGKFPVKDAGEDGYAGIAPVKSFPPNGYGLYDIAGNVWEWCSDWYRPDYYQTLVDKGGVAHNPQGPDSAFDPSEPDEKKRVHRGGSFLCNDQYCSRYIVGTRGKGEVNTGTNHLGFRCVRSPENVAQRTTQN